MKPAQFLLAYTHETLETKRNARIPSSSNKAKIPNINEEKKREVLSQRSELSVLE